MGQQELTDLADKLIDDPELRALFGRDPQAAAKQAGISLDDEDREALENLNVAGMDDAELVARISKRGARM